MSRYLKFCTHLNTLVVVLILRDVKSFGGLREHDKESSVWTKVGISDDWWLVRDDNIKTEKMLQ